MHVHCISCGYDSGNYVEFEDLRNKVISDGGVMNLREDPKCDYLVTTLVCPNGSEGHQISLESGDGDEIHPG